MERLYGIRNGRPEKLPNNSEVKSQSDLAKEFGMSVDTLNNYKKLTEMIPELQDLLETNIRQRGDVGGSAKKVGLRIKELERLYGIRNGGDRKSEANNSLPNYSEVKSQSDLAKEFGMSVDTLNNYKKLTEMIPELQDLLETNIRQRGDVGGSAKKVGLRIKELERLYGIRNGGDRKSDQNNLGLITQQELARKLNMTDQQLRNYKKLTEMIPELEDLLETNIRKRGGCHNLATSHLINIKGA